MRLVWLPAKGRPAGTGAFWFNPEHVTTLTPRIADGGEEHVTVYVRIKLQGLTEAEYWLGDFTTRTDANAAWQGFLDRLTGDHLDVADRETVGPDQTRPGGGRPAGP